MTPELVKEWFSYDHLTGVIRWRKSPARNVFAGDVAGAKHPQGYWVITFRRKQYQAHRVAWCHHYGAWPSKGLDHRDTVRNHNAIKNLREATNVEQNRNRRATPKNKSGFKGVSWDYNCYRAFVYDQGKRIDLGRFDKPETAHAAYCAEAQRRFGEFWRAS